MNPTGQPFGMGMNSPPPPPTVDARGQLNVPSLLLIVCAGLAILTLVGANLFQGALFELLIKLNPAARSIIEQSQRDQSMGSKLLGYAFTALLVALNGLVIFGALQMRNLKNWGLAMTAAVLGVIPFCPTYMCCCLALPVGIWALVILNKPEVKAQFT